MMPLREYQRQAVRHFLSRPRCALWAGMGMGKTLATLTALAVLKSFGELSPAAPALVIAPLRVASCTWPDECRKWSALGLRCVAAVGTPKQRTAALRSGADIIAINFESLPWLIKMQSDAWPYSCIVVDEASRLKGFRLGGGGGQRTRALSRVAFLSQRFWELTGTPAPNGLLDLWAQAWFLDRGVRLGHSFSAFTSQYFKAEQVAANPWAKAYTPLEGSPEQIQAALADVALSVRPEDFFPLESPIFSDVEITMPDHAQELYTQLESSFFADLEALGIGEGGIDIANAAARSGKCLQVAAGAIYREDGSWEPVHDAKIEALGSIIEEAAGEPLLIAYHWRADAERIKKAYPQAVMMDKDPRTIQKWNAGKIPLLLVHPAAAGHGLNLQDGGRRLVLFSPWWNLEEYQQVLERIGPVRQLQAGHPRSVIIHRLIARGTLDRDVLTRLSGKASMQEVLLEAVASRKKEAKR